MPLIFRLRIDWIFLVIFWLNPMLNARNVPNNIISKEPQDSIRQRQYEKDIAKSYDADPSCCQSIVFHVQSTRQHIVSSGSPNQWQLRFLIHIAFQLQIATHIPSL